MPLVVERSSLSTEMMVETYSIELSTKGYQIARSWESLEKINSGKVFAVPYLVDTPLPDERGDLLARASLKGIELL